MPECGSCGTPVVLSLQGGNLHEVETEGWREHVCPPANGTVMECVCGGIVLLDPDGTRRDYPSGKPHAMHVRTHSRTGNPQDHSAERKALAVEHERRKPRGLDL